MAEEQRHLYHCDRCGELFKSEQRAQEDIICSSCGEHPVKPKFAAVAEMPALAKRHKKNKHGIPGVDKADIFSMKKKKQRFNLLIVCVMWIGGLMVIAYMTNKLNKQAKSAASRSDLQLSEEDKAYLVRKNDALQKCTNRFIQFASDTIVHSKSTHMLNGSDLVLDINRYYRGNLMKNDLAASRMLAFNLIENGDEPKAAALYRYQPNEDQTAEAYDFEVLFWKQEEDWYIDWPHFVRLGDMTWFRFSEDKNKNSPKRFKLYVREPSTESLGLNGFTEYKFSEAYNNSTIPSQLEELVLVKNQTPLKTRLNKAFRELGEKKKSDDSSIIGSFDPSGKIRVDVTLDFEDIEGETMMVLKEIHDFDWETPPTGSN